MSSAFDILQAADHRSAEPSASFMIHHEHFSLSDDASAPTHANEGNASMARAKLVFEEWSVRTGRSADFYTKLISTGEYYFDANKALSEGLIDEIAIIKPYVMTPAQGGKGPAVKRKRATKVIEESKDTNG
jgi:ATP-dependent protease ClpP protease subunit